MTRTERVMVVVHPGSACGSADFNLGDGAGKAREDLARDIMAWQGDMLVIDGELSEEIAHYAMIAIAFENAADRKDRRMLRLKACDADGDWPRSVGAHVATEWPGGPHEFVVTGAWLHADGGGCVGAVAEVLSGHRVTVAPSTLKLEA